MINRTLVDELVNSLLDSMDKVGAVKEDVEKHIRATLSSTLDRMDIITRDEFELMRDMVLRTRERMEVLEKRVALLEGQEESPAPASLPKPSDDKTSAPSTDKK